MNDHRWLNCRLVDVQQRLADTGYHVSKKVISRILRQHGYTLRANVKQAAGKQNPDRDQQFEYIRYFVSLSIGKLFRYGPLAAVPLFNSLLQ